MRLSFTGRLIGTIGLSTLLLTSLYWLMGWHYVERLEESHEGSMLHYFEERFDRVVSGELPRESLELFDIARLYDSAETLPERLRPYADPARFGVYAPAEGELLIVRPSPLNAEPYFVHVEHLERMSAPDESEAFEAGLVVGGILLFTLGAMGLTLSLVWYQTRPVRELTRAVAAVDPAHPAIEPLVRDDDLGAMSRQIADLLQRIAGFIERERNFTRFAGHELRSPLTAIRSSIDLLHEAGIEHPLQQRAVRRIDVAAVRMTKLLDAFLWLSRETPERERYGVDLSRLRELLSQIEQLTPELCDRLGLVTEETILWSIDPFVLSVILDNLLRNGLEHGEGAIECRVRARSLEIVNRVESRQTETGSHFGYGLKIVELLCDKADCQFEHHVESGCYRVRLSFPG